MFEVALIPGAFIAGLFMFLAPCTLPIVPGYLAFIAGGEGKVMRNAFAFVLGFTLIFILLGLFAGFFGMILGPYRGVISQVAGLIFILFGLTMFGVRIPFLSVERHVAVSSFSVGKVWSSFGIGALFALGWSPCIGPILGTVLLLASQSSTTVEGVVLLAVFALGMGIPFLLTAYFIDSAGKFFNRIGALTQYSTYLGAVMLIGFGVLMLFNQMGVFVLWGLSFFDSFYQTILPYM
ncbi:cytochrome c biogenesis protein CcdA [Candidatus Parcubacteria bacterium]|nr:cytochrome c biogenesis protein CcdA [Candidatus Parcubacteria bacterium]